MQSEFYNKMKEAILLRKLFMMINNLSYMNTTWGTAIYKLNDNKKIDRTFPAK